MLMLFHPPDFNFHSIDRFAFGLLILVVLLRVCVLRQPLRLGGLVTWPMLAMLLLAFYGVVSQPNDAETWSLFAAKWLVPFTLYQLAAYIFDDAQSLRRFETFSLVVLGYLSLTAIFFMIDAKQFIFPRYILDESLGYHADRARGPFLQAVANGVALNLLGACPQFIPAQTAAGTAGASLFGVIASGNCRHQDARRLAFVCLVNSWVAIFFIKSPAATRLPLSRHRWRHWTRDRRHFRGSQCVPN
jgi:hypothetical protein